MEWYQDVFRVLSLVVVWAIPSIVILALLIFIIITPAFTITGIVLRLYDSVRSRIAKKTSVAAKPQVATRHPLSEPTMSSSKQEKVIPEPAIAKEPVATKT